MASRDPLFITSTAKALRVLEQFSVEQNGLTIGDLAERLGENRSSVQRSVHTLTKSGYLRRDDGTARYRPANRCLLFANGFLRCDSLIERAIPFLVSAHNECEETVNLSQLTGADIMLVYRIPSRRTVSISMHIGSTAPAFCTAPGRAILAYRPEEEIEFALAGPLTAFTPHTLTDPADIREKLEETRRQGFAMQTEELAIGDLSVAAPVRLPNGQAVAAVNIAVPTARFTAKQLQSELAPLVIHTARAITNSVVQHPPAAS